MIAQLAEWWRGVGDVGPWLADSAVRATLWLVAYVLVDGLLRLARTAASLRHALAVLAALGVPLIFVFSTTAVHHDVTWHPDESLERAWTAVRTAPAVERLVAPAPAIVDQVPSAPRHSHWPELVASIWVVGLAVGACLLVFRGRCVAIPDGDAGERFCLELAEEASRFGLRRIPRLTMGGSGIPMVSGLLMPTLVLPAAAREWSRSRRLAIVRHELAHVARRDAWWSVAVAIALLPLWFHPLAWWLRRRIGVLRELACDDAVLRAGTSPLDYAETLLALLPRRRPRNSARVLTAFDHPDPAQRLRALLDPRTRRDSASWWKVAAFAALVLAAGCPATMLVGCAHQQEKSEAWIPPLPTAPSSSLDAPAATPVGKHPSLLTIRLTYIGTTAAVGQADRQRFDAIAAQTPGILSPEAGREFFRRGLVLDPTSQTVRARPGQEIHVENTREFIHPLTWKWNPEAGIEVPASFQTTDTGFMTRVEVRPTDDPSRVFIDITPFICEFVGFETTAEHPDREIPVFSKRTTDFQGEIENGSFILIATRRDEQSVGHRIPVLGALPGVGRLFRREEIAYFDRLVAVRVLVAEVADD
ncbi:hypothetical protein BH23VER1_BH23VER1_04290 [soil metagenome]